MERREFIKKGILAGLGLAIVPLIDKMPQETEAIAPVREAPKVEFITVTTGEEETFRVAVGSPFVDTMRRLAKEKGFSRFQVFVDGRSVPEGDVPKTVEKGSKIEFREFLW